MTNGAPRAHIVGYARVSTSHQNLDRQLDKLAEMGAVKIFSDKVSGRTMDRPAWKSCREYLRPGDTLAVDALDRLGRSTLEVIGTVKELVGLGIKIIDKSGRRLDTSDPIGEALVAIMAVMAQMEVDLKAERAAAAREAAAARGQHTGRPRKLTTSDAVRAHELKAQGLSAGEVGKALGISRASVYRYLSAPETEAAAT
ncbi:hypothetical protein BJD99_19115 [Rhodococcus sp. 1163]|uniref:recombinase family protein n=1 Tax=Rhodococcus sp. 1163 TaxID=1905289 RepID=UPI000A01D384|nr:recombinase family protein [Rhodococcus sp. 1163]ORI18854.1 hypothetical protein BJD99_19115 [Rhodococcus sp. 1163]